MWRLGLPAVAIAALLAATRPSSAQPAPAAAYTGPSGELGDAVRGRLARFAADRGLGFADLADPRPPASGGAALLERASAAYFEFRYDEAVALLDQLITAVAASGGAGLDRRQLADAFLFRALAHTELGRRAEGRDDLIRAATIHPAYPIDKARFRPSLVAAFERAREAALEGPRARVALSFPPGCEVSIDAASTGAAEVVSLVPGAHYLRARCPGHRTLVAEPTFAPGEQRYRPRLEPLPPDRDRALASTEAPLVIWVSLSRVDRGRTEIVLVDREAGKVRRRWTLGLEGAADARRLDPILASLIERELRLEAPPPEVVIREPEKRWYQREWVWVAVGAAAASAAILPFALSGSESSGWSVDVGVPR